MSKFTKLFWRESYHVERPRDINYSLTNIKMFKRRQSQMKPMCRTYFNTRAILQCEAITLDLYFFKVSSLKSWHQSLKGDGPPLRQIKIGIVFNSEYMYILLKILCVDFVSFSHLMRYGIRPCRPLLI